MSPSAGNNETIPTPYIVLYGSTNIKLQQLLEATEFTYACDPAGFLNDISQFRDNPDNARDGSLWRQLVDKEVALDYGFDKDSEAAIKTDELYRKYANSSNIESGQNMRRRKVALFLSRILQAEQLGTSSTVDD